LTSFRIDRVLKFEGNRGFPPRQAAPALGVTCKVAAAWRTYSARLPFFSARRAATVVLAPPTFFGRFAFVQWSILNSSHGPSVVE
jgi:hypothetical protein